MFKITPAAATEIRKSISQGGMSGLALRIAATTHSDGSIVYKMGFDEVAETDVHLTSEGIDIVIGSSDKALLSGAVMDFVEIEPGSYRFIFMNPNDPHYNPPL